jgi:hypothetical protein
MTSQIPAQGILKVNDWGSSKMYKVVCNCGDDHCTHTVDIEADDHDVTVTIYTQTRTNFWSMSRWSHIWKLLTKGYTDFETVILMNKQVALNYASVLQSAVSDVETFKKERKEKSAASKLAEQGDCV